MLLRYENTFDRVARADIEQPFPGAIGRSGIPQHARRTNFSGCSELCAQGFWNVGHDFETVGAALVDPALELARAKRLLADPGAKLREPVFLKFEQVDGHG